MGLLSFLFGKKNKASASPVENLNTDPSQRGYISASKVDLNVENYGAVCKEFIAFDTETTELSSENDVIIEIGAVRFENGSVKESYSSLVNEGRTVPEAAFQVNHISTQMLVDYGKKPEVVYRELTEFLKDVLSGKVCICAHNASFDMSFLCKALERFGYSGTIRYIDTLSLARKMIKGLPNYKQDTIACYFSVVNDNAHRAASDAEVCGSILVKLLNMKKDEVKKEIRKSEKCIPTDEEKEVFAIIANSLKENGIDIENLCSYRNSSNYVHVIDTYSAFKFKLTKKKSFVVVPKLYADGLENVEECTNTEGTTNVRILFDDPFELTHYGEVFSSIISDVKKSGGMYLNQYETEYLAKASLTAFTSTEIESYLEKAKYRKIAKAEYQEQIKQKELQQAEIKKEKKEAKEKRRQVIEKEKQEKSVAKIERQIRIRKMIEEAQNVSKDDIAQIAKLSADTGRRAVLQLDDNDHILKIYESISEASNSVGIAPKTIRDVANGKYKHGGGFCWKFADDYLK